MTYAEKIRGSFWAKSERYSSLMPHVCWVTKKMIWPGNTYMVITSFPENEQFNVSLPGVALLKLQGAWPVFFYGKTGKKVI